MHYKHLDENLLLEMAEIGRIDGYKILIYGAEGPIPHFHVLHKDNSVKSCIKILEDGYFKHGEHQDTLEKSVVKKLKLFLNQPHRTFGKHGYTNWQIICIYWNDNNPDYLIEDDLDKLVMPEYNNL